jgi:hypothetical protein
LNLSDQLEFHQGYASFRPVGTLTLPEAIQLGREAIRVAAEHDVLKLMMVATGVTGLPIPTTWERFALAEEWARVGRGVKVAVVSPPELIDPTRFGVTVARNRGMVFDVFTTESEALAWLLDPA